MGVNEFVIRTTGICLSILAALLEAPSLVGVRICTRWIMKGAVQLSEVMAQLQPATVAITTAEAVGMDGDLDDPKSSEENSSGQGKDGPSQDE